MSVALPHKLELALICYLYRFGGKISPQLISDFPELFDNLAALTPNPLVTGTDFDGVTFFPGHSAVDMDTLPRIIVTCAQAGGNLAYDGYDDCMVEILSLSESKDVEGQSTRYSALRAILTQERVFQIQAEINAPLSGPDNRAIQGIGLDGIEFKDQLEGRDEKGNQHGTRLALPMVAHLEA